MKRPAYLHAAVGTVLTRYAVDVEGASLTALDQITEDAKIQYLWQHPSRDFVYLAVSNGGPGNPGDLHHLSAYKVDAKTGALSPHGTPAKLQYRPLHLCTDAQGKHLLTAYNNPSAFTVHRIEADGSIGAEVPQSPPVDVGVFGHQVLMLPSGKAAVLVTRGNDASDDNPEDPGALKIYDYADGRASDRATIAPKGGFGFGARHLDFHPTEPWAYVSVERQNRVHMYSLSGDDFAAEPAFDVNSLVDPDSARPRQHAGAIHVHPNGKFVYQSNRSDTVEDWNGGTVFLDGENSIAAYAIDSSTGSPTRIQNAPTDGFVPRTFAIDPTGQLLIAGNSIGLPVRDGDGVRAVPPSLMIYCIGADGRLNFQRKYEIDAENKFMFWIGIVS
jgi:6-phosphogluconolactonase